ncbi:hypothetical protein [Belnapia arida]|uniref:hypothetical protein n=1 Tax=Belnapia arida TaxID=2804533 RepID=UPI001F2C8B3C|nr:hypothetical protein [Belnapia arida]
MTGGGQGPCLSRGGGPGLAQAYVREALAPETLRAEPAAVAAYLASLRRPGAVQART